MIDEFAKDYLHKGLRRHRKALLWKLDGLSEYDTRRPLTATGTNLLGLVKHVATVEARYFGEVFDRPSRNPCHGGRTMTAATCGRPRTRPANRSSASTDARGNTLTRRSTSFPSTPPAMCHGGRNLVPTRTCSPSWSTFSASPSAMPDTPTSCAKDSTAGPGRSLNTRRRSTRKPAQPTVPRSSRQPGQPHSAIHNLNRATVASLSGTNPGASRADPADWFLGRLCDGGGGPIAVGCVEQG